MKRKSIAFLLFLFPCSFCRFLFSLLNIQGVHIGRNCKVGFSLLLSPKIDLEDGSRIGHCNYINVNSFYLGGGIVRCFNIIKGTIDVRFENKSWMHSFNKISGVAIYKANHFVVRKDTQIGMWHVFNVSDSIEIGANSCMAGSGSQVWTHSFLYGKEKKVRVDGEVKIGDNCYIGSRVVICPGVKIANNISIGANTTVTKNLEKPGLYVSQPIRYIEEWNADEQISKLGIEVSENICRKR